MYNQDGVNKLKPRTYRPNFHFFAIILNIKYDFIYDKFDKMILTKIGQFKRNERELQLPKSAVIDIIRSVYPVQSPDFSQYKLSPKWLETKNLYIKQ